MHGIVFLQLKKFLQSATNDDLYKKIMTDSGQNNTIFNAMKSYPDGDLVAIVESACRHLGIDRETALEEFGKFIVPGLLGIYGAYLQPEWKSLDLLEHVESTIHRAVRLNNPGAEPPKLKVTRKSEKEVEIDYTSPRQMISLGVGIIKKIGDHFGENLMITKTDIPNGSRLSIQTA